MHRVKAFKTAVAAALTFGITGCARLPAKPADTADTYRILSERVVPVDGLPDEYHYTISHGTVTYEVRYGESQTTNYPYHGFKLEDENAKPMQFDDHYYYFHPDTSIVPEVGSSIPACKMDDTLIDDIHGPVPCMSRNTEGFYYMSTASEYAYVKFVLLSARSKAR